MLMCPPTSFYFRSAKQPETDVDLLDFQHLMAEKIKPLQNDQENKDVNETDFSLWGRVFLDGQIRQLSSETRLLKDSFQNLYDGTIFDSFLRLF